MSDPISRSERATVRRVSKRGAYDRDTIHQILDAGVVCHVGFVDGGQPYVIPMAYARQGDRLLLHGSVLSRLMRTLAGGVPVCATVTHLDALVLARSWFHHSMNYRSVVVLGTARAITDDDEKMAALAALVEHLVPGRAAGSRAPTDKELAATDVLALPIDEASAKIRSGPPSDPAEDLALDVWAGVVPLVLEAGEPIPSPDLRPGIPVPDHAHRSGRPGDC
jgi:hypothetical protein